MKIELMVDVIIKKELAYYFRVTEATRADYLTLEAKKFFNLL